MTTQQRREHVSATEPAQVELPTEALWRIRLRLFGRKLRTNWGLFTDNKIGLVGLAIIALFGLMALAHPILMNTVWDPDVYDPRAGYGSVVVEKTIVSQIEDPAKEVSLADAMTMPNVNNPQVGDTVTVAEQPAGPSSEHWLGIDQNGRDIFSQLLAGAQAAFGLGVIAALVTVVLATVVGSVAAYFGGLSDQILMRIADLFLLLPLIPALAFLGGLFDPSLVVLAVAVGLVSGFGGTAILLKSQALAVKVKPFIDAARVAGGSHAHIIFRHIVPNVVPLAFFSMMVSVTIAISTEATLAYLGLINLDMSWGLMIQTAQTGGYLLSGFDYWYMLLPAGLAVTLLSAAFYLVGRALDEVVNPRLRSR